jgi:hypothetical protein
MKTLFTGFVHRIVGLFLTDGMKGVISGTSAESELIPILLDPRALMDSELAEFLEEWRGEINGAASEIVKLLRRFEKTHGSVKEKKHQDMKDYASHVKSDGVPRETDEIRGNQYFQRDKRRDQYFQHFASPRHWQRSVSDCPLPKDRN